jgi:hypothetical protein
MQIYFNYRGGVNYFPISAFFLQQNSIQYFINKKEKTMKRVIASVLLLLIITSGFVFAQDSDEVKKKVKPTVVLQQNMVPLVQMGRYIEITNEYWAPGFDKLVDEGKLIKWSYMTHAWGDEWNIVVRYVAKDFATFLKAWGEGYKSFTESAPEEVRDEFGGMHTAHKDNIYTGQYYYDGNKE